MSIANPHLGRDRSENPQEIAGVGASPSQASGNSLLVPPATAGGPVPALLTDGETDFESFWGFAESTEVVTWESFNSVPGLLDSRMTESSESFEATKGRKIPSLKPADELPVREAFTWGEVPKSSLTSGGHDSLKQTSEKLGRRRRVAVTARRLTPVIHVRSYFAPSWFTSIGVFRKRKMIEGKGMPNLHNWRFITLTVCQKLHPCPLAAYKFGSDHMRRFMYACREAGLWKAKYKWCWKFEFQANGWPHWHLLLARRSMFTHAQLALIGELWGMGRTSVERVNEKDFRYNFKYAFKPVVLENEFGDDDEFERCAPDWFLDYIGEKTVSVKWEDEQGIEHSERATKPATFSRVRFWQTSRGFYTKRKIEKKPAGKRSSSTVPRTSRQVMVSQARTVQVVARRSSGQYESSTCVQIDKPLDNFWNLVGFDTVNGGAVGLGVFSYVIPTHRIKTDPTKLCQLQQVIRSNRLSLRHALILQERGETLRTC